MAIKSGSAIRIILSIIALILLYHLVILLGIVPYEYAWGGRLGSKSEMYVFETVSIILNLFLAYILLLKGKLINGPLSHKIVDIILWVFCILFAINTLGNLFAKTYFEKMFAALTLMLAYLIYRILRPAEKL